MVSANDIRAKYLKFFKDRGHVEIPSAPLVPENDLTTLFTSSGMQPLVPNLLGQPHPSGKRLVNSQKCFRAQDIDEVGDNRHTTFFEMLGNWSLGDYFKEEQLAWFYEFLTKELKLQAEKLAVSVFEGEGEIPRDEESAKIWKKLGIPESRIFYYGVKKNWWSRSGVPENMPAGEPGGPDSEVFYEFTDVQHDPKFGKICHPNCDCGRFLEIGNSVFMQYQKQTDGSFKELPQKNVDFGGGLERLTAAANNEPDIFKIDLLWNLVEKISQIAGINYEKNETHFRVIADHIRAATFLAAEGIPAMSDNKHGSMLRRLIDKALEESRKLGIENKFLPQLSEVVISNYKNSTPLLIEKSEEIKNTFSSVESWVEERMVTPSFEASTIDDLPFMSNQEMLINMERYHNKIFGSQTFEKYIKDNPYISLPSVYAGTLAFKAKTAEGYPVSASETHVRSVLPHNFNENEYYKTFNNYYQQHREISKKAGEKLFKGGLADHSEQAVKFHTATHLLHAALRQVLGTHVSQKGSNITVERLRFDFSHPEKLTDEQIKQVEDLVNDKIKEDIKVERVEMPKSQALAEGALAFFPEKYPEITFVYSIGNFSKELCGGPHVQSTGEIGRIKITRQEAVSAGVRRIYAVAIHH